MNNMALLRSFGYLLVILVLRQNVQGVTDEEFAV